jgi:PilZ domain
VRHVASEHIVNHWDRSTRGPEAGPTDHPKRGNRRAAARRRQRLIDGFVFTERLQTRPCTVCDMSATGSRIEVWGNGTQSLQPGVLVTLYIPSDRQEIDAEVRWRKANVMGLRFASAFRDPTRSYG